VGEEITILDAQVSVHGLGAEEWQTERKMYEYKTSLGFRVPNVFQVRTLITLRRFHFFGQEQFMHGHLG
jgi:hypothetical protein